MWNQHTLGDSPRPDHLRRIVPMRIPGALTLRPVREGERSTPRILRKSHSTHTVVTFQSDMSVSLVSDK